MPKMVKVNGSADEAVRGLLASLLESGAIEGAFTLSKKGKTAAYSLIATGEELKNALPFHPLMPANAAGILSRITALEAVDRPVAAVLRPCELRALRELS